VDRYIDALTSSVIPNRAGELVPNPIFSDLDTSDNVTTIRDPGLVVLATIVGVPWQDVARNPADLTQGYKSAAELGQPDAAGNTGWDIIVGNPASYVPPLDPLMVESVGPRSGRTRRRARRSRRRAIRSETRSTGTSGPLKT
jgi:hypothetical protein